MKLQLGKLRGRAVLLLLAALMVAPCFGADPAVDRMGEISKQIEALSQKLQQCGSNTDCMQKVSQEMIALQQEYVQLAQATAKGPGGQPAIQGLSCATFFRPGWSCLPIKMHVTDRVEIKGYGSYPVAPGDWKWYVASDVLFAYTADGSGILTYTKGFKEFRIDITSVPAGNKISQFSWHKRGASYTGYTNQTWTSSNGPQVPVKVLFPCSFILQFPPDPASGSLPPFHYRFNPLVISCDDEWGGQDGTRVPYEGSPAFQMTPETVKAMVDSQQLTKTFSWRLKTGAGADDPSYEDHNLTIRFEVGEPVTEEPGALAVSPGDGFSSSRSDPKKSFAPLSKAYTLSNKGKQVINYSVSKKATWLKLDNTGGSLAPGGSVTVTASVDVPVASKLTEDTYKDTITFTNTTNNKGNTTRPADLTIGEEQKWQVFLTGYEIDEMDAYWKITTKVRGAIRFDYKLRGEFTIAKKKGKWQYKGGTITIADVGLSNLYEPLEAWMVKPLKCINCSLVQNLKGTPLAGFVEGNEVKLGWGTHWPKTLVTAKIAIPCKPMPKCADWGDRLFVSTEFFDRVNLVPLPLKHEGTVGPKKPIVSPQGLRWINYTYTLRRLK